jgi:PadR family transcriptional regulator PadR
VPTTARASRVEPVNEVSGRSSSATADASSSRRAGALAPRRGARHAPQFVTRYIALRCIVSGLTEQALFILASLASGELHGYGIARDVEELSDGRLKLTAGTLYGALNRLAAGGLVVQSREDVVDGRRRRYYRLTSAGEKTLAEETAKLRSTAAALSARSRPVLGRRAKPA